MTNPATPPPSAPPPSSPARSGMPKWLMILIVVLLVVFLGCCGGFTACFLFARKAANTAVNALPAMIEAEQKRAGIEVDTTGAGLALPPSFPSDVPVFAGFKATYKMAMGDTAGSVSFEGSESPQKVAAFYTSEMEKKGWKQVISSTDTDGISQTYLKDKNGATLQITRGPKTILQITYSKNE